TLNVFLTRFTSLLSSRRETDAAQHLDKSRVGAQQIVGRVHADTEHVVGVFVVSFAQPDERLLLVAQAAIYSGDVNRRDPFTRGERIQFPQQLQRLASLAGSCIAVGQPGSMSMEPVQIEGSAQLADGFLMLSLLAKDKSHF